MVLVGYRLGCFRGRKKCVTGEVITFYYIGLFVTLEIVFGKSIKVIKS